MIPSRFERHMYFFYPINFFQGTPLYKGRF